MAGLVAIIITIVVTFVHGLRESQNTERKLEDAEKKVYDIDSESIKQTILSLHESHADLKEQADSISRIIQESQQRIILGNLFNLYSKQIEKYQQETRTRATFSFFFAILSMSAGMGFMFWGGSFILADPTANHVAAGAAISAIGGGISAYITTTFLDVHKLSLTQLNRYFTQPVINDHIVMAQRLAEDVKDDEVRKKSYEKIVNSITALIDATNADLHKSGGK
ncbi:TRADD-N-associated membrane domain-containing protein [Candidatus Electronema sp. TJ]|uniref:TRADD-N-associated membrane domain-containing protein n=1 Tax=Candidatus Electronema sp. TJ TaxID=3401573 RepID=UPI003AA9BB2C